MPADSQRDLTRLIAARVRALRGTMPARALAEAMTAQGIKWDRNTVVALESGRRQALTVEEVFALAYVLEVSPLYLLGLDADSDDPWPMTPAEPIPARVVRHWVRYDSDGTQVRAWKAADQAGRDQLRRAQTGVMPTWLGPDIENALRDYPTAARSFIVEIAIYGRRLGHWSLFQPDLRYLSREDLAKAFPDRFYPPQEAADGAGEGSAVHDGPRPGGPDEEDQKEDRPAP